MNSYSRQGKALPSEVKNEVIDLSHNLIGSVKMSSQSNLV